MSQILMQPVSETNIYPVKVEIITTSTHPGHSSTQYEASSALLATTQRPKYK